MEIVSIEENYNDKTIEIETWDWGFPIPTWKLYDWNTLAEGEGTVCSTEWTEQWWAGYDNEHHKFIAPTDFEDEMWANKINNDYVLTLDGTSQFLTNLGTGWNLNVDPGNVIGAFIKSDRTPSGEPMCILSHCRVGTQGWEFGINTNNALYFSFQRAVAPTNWITKTSQTNTVSPGTWQAVHVGINKVNIIDDQDMAIFFYKNGTQVGTTLYEVGTALIDPSAVAFKHNGLGASNINTSPALLSCRWFDGQMGDVVYYGGGTRSAADMTRLFNGLRGRYGL